MVSESELWIEYSLGTFTFLLRFFARWKVVGIRNFAWDDLFAFIAMVKFPGYFHIFPKLMCVQIAWTADAVVVHIIGEFSFQYYREKGRVELM